MTSEKQSSPPSLGLGSVSWSITNDKCKKVNKSISHCNHQHLARKPKYEKERHQNVYRPVHPSASWSHGRTRRVHFPPTECHDRQKSVSPSSSVITVVSSLLWSDHRGIMGNYTGQVNALMQPHGSGALVYDGGIARTCIWRNGMPVQLWRPKKKKKKVDHRNQALSSSPTFLPHLDIGDVATPQDSMMIQETSDSNEIDSLQTHDFAFVLRSDGQSWTYAIIANRQADSILFVVDTKGSTKMLSRKDWTTSVRLVNSLNTYAVPHNPTLRSSVSHLKDDTSTDVPCFIRRPPFPRRQSSSSI